MNAPILAAHPALAPYTRIEIGELSIPVILGPSGPCFSCGNDAATYVVNGEQVVALHIPCAKALMPSENAR